MISKKNTYQWFQEKHALETLRMKEDERHVNGRSIVYAVYRLKKLGYSKKLIQTLQYLYK